MAPVPWIDQAQGLLPRMCKLGWHRRAQEGTSMVRHSRHLPHPPALLDAPSLGCWQTDQGAPTLLQTEDPARRGGRASATAARVPGALQCPRAARAGHAGDHHQGRPSGSFHQAKGFSSSGALCSSALRSPAPVEVQAEAPSLACTASTNGPLLSLQRPVYAPAAGGWGAAAAGQLRYCQECPPPCSHRGSEGPSAGRGCGVCGRSSPSLSSGRAEPED
mmetsp:Transcript_25755/g.60771  ORF Transcript_25755/g.60771 Transcript_25755/m.60771 type:complete len:219 (-) Transcript_25755:652-1308(-)